MKLFDKVSTREDAGYFNSDYKQWKFNQPKKERDMVNHLKKNYQTVINAYYGIKSCFCDVTKLKAVNLYKFLSKPMPASIVDDAEVCRYQFTEILVE